MSEQDPRSLLGDILAATTRPASVPPPVAAAVPPTPPPVAIPTPPRYELGDLLRLDDDDWRRFLGEIAPDDLVVLCSAGVPAWRERVLICLDQDSRNWLRANLASLGDAAPALLNEVRGRALDAARRLLRNGTITLPGTTPATVPAPAANAETTADNRPAKKMDTIRPAARDTVNVSFVAPGVPQPAMPTPTRSTTDRPVIGAVSMSFGEMPTPTPTAATATPAHHDDDGLEALFADLLRLRNQAGTAALLPLASDVPDPFLQSGLRLVAAGLPAAELERALDGALARQAEAYLDHLTGMRARLLALARGNT